MIALQMRNKQEQKEMHYRQMRNAESKRRWWFCWCGISKSKKKWAICRRGTLKAKSDGGFEDTEQAREKRNGLSASAER